MATTQYRIQGSEYGLPGFDAVITIPTQVDGRGIGEFPRNDMEQGMLDQVLDALTQQAGVDKSKLTPDGGVYSDEGAASQAEEVIQNFDQMRIKDPIRTDLNLAESLAKDSAFGASTFVDQLTNIFPGGDTFQPEIMTQSLQDFFLRRAPDDPKRALGDMSVIASDLFLMGLSIGNVKFAGKHGNLL